MAKYAGRRRLILRSPFLSRTFNTDKRRYLRYEVLDYAIIQSLDSFDTWQSVIVDIGLGGLQVRTRQPLPVGTICKLQVGQTDEATLNLRGEVRHCKPVDNSDLFATGVRFMPDTHEERMAIAEFVHGVFQRQCDLLTL